MNIPSVCLCHTLCKLEWSVYVGGGGGGGGTYAVSPSLPPLQLFTCSKIAKFDALYTRRGTPPPLYTRRGTPPPLYTRRGTPPPLYTRRGTPPPLYTRRGTPSPSLHKEGYPLPLIYDLANTLVSCHTVAPLERNEMK